MSTCFVAGSVHPPWNPACTAVPAVAITLPHGSKVDDSVSVVPAGVNIPDRSICCSVSAIVFTPAVVSTPVTEPDGSREYVAFFFFNDTAPTEIYTLSLHDALPI